MKNKKLTVNKLATGNLKARKKQYTLMITGILLAMIFSSGVLFFISCMQSSEEEQNRREIGNFWGYFYQPKDYIDVEQGKKDGFIEQYGYAHIIGYGFTDDEEQSKGTPIAWLDETAKELYYVTVLDGKYPEKEGEIALEADAAIRLGIEPKAGEKITLSVLTADGEDYLPASREKTYTLVGILEDKRANIERSEGMGPDAAPMPAAFVSEKEQVDAGGKENIALYYNPTEESLKRSIKKTDEFGNTYTQSPFIEYFLSEVYDNLKAHPDDTIPNEIVYIGSSYGTTLSIFSNSGIIAVLAVVLTIASCIGIINAFTTNLQERRRQIGLLRAVGTTRRQIINIFGREAFIITLICAPISIAISYFGVWLFAKIMGDSFIFIPDFLVLLGTAAISIICVMLSALIPLIYAARVSPMQAIRNTELSRKMKRKKIKTQKHFNAPKLLAERSINFYKAKQAGVSIILVLTILLTCFGFTIIKNEFENAGWSVYNVGDYKISRGGSPQVSNYVNMPNRTDGISLNDLGEIISYPLFDTAYGKKECISYFEADEYSEYMDLLSCTWQGIRYEGKSRNLTEYVTNSDYNLETFKKYWFEDSENKQYTRLKAASKAENELFITDIQGYDECLIEQSLDKFEIIDGKIDIEKLNSGEEIILVAPKEIGISVELYDDGSVLSYGIFDTNDLPDYFHRENREIYATATLDYKAGDTVRLKTLFSESTTFDYDESGFEQFGEITANEKDVKIGAIVKPFSFGDYMYNHDELGIVTTSQGIEVIAGRSFPYEELIIEAKNDITEETDELANGFLEGIVAGTNFRAYSGFTQNKELEETVQMLLIALISVVILFFSICASIVNNSLTAKIRESKREIGTLRAVGASAREITQSYIRQLFAMFGWGCTFGFTGYVIGYIVLVWYFKDPQLPFEIWQALLIILALFAICSINLYAKIKKEMKNSIVENIREL